MDQKVKREWVKALRSGKYRQTRDVLYNGKSYCCLGVLCRVVGAKWKDGAFHWEGDEDGGILPDKLRRQLKITPAQEESLTLMNDGGGTPEAPQKTFKEIADYIEAKL